MVHPVTWTALAASGLGVILRRFRRPGLVWAVARELRPPIQRHSARGEDVSVLAVFGVLTMPAASLPAPETVLWF